MWLFGSFLLVSFYVFYLYKTEIYKDRVLGKEIYLSIRKSNEKSKSGNLLIGDSVGKQFYDNTHEDSLINSLACNHGISMAGMYILVQNYLESGNEIDNLIIFTSPLLFENNLEEYYNFNYFLKPFFKEKYKGHFTPTVWEKIKKNPFYRFSQLPWIKTINWSPRIEIKKEEDYHFLSPISVEYLKKIEALSNKHNFNTKIISPPISESKAKQLKSIEVKNEINDHNLTSLFDVYFDEMIIMDNENFIQETHLTNIALTKDLRQIVKDKVLKHL